MAFYVSHMPQIQRARVHQGACPHCLNGQGTEAPQKPGSGKANWSRAFNSLGEARTYMMTTFGKYKSLGMCPTCKPGG